jgi:ABC-type branched-subunit amino acid transport system ATPase component
MTIRGSGFSIWTTSRTHGSKPNIVLNVNGIEVIYNHVILVLKVRQPSTCLQGNIVAILGGNGAGKTTTLASGLQPAARRAW